MKIDGKSIAKEKETELKLRVENFKRLTGRSPKLAIILAGDDPASKIYVAIKQKKARELGIDTEIRQDLNTNADGIIVQLPGPEKLILQIPLEKDVDGLTVGSPFLPATVKAVLTVIASVAKQSLEVWVVVGQGRLVGKPLADFLEKEGNIVIRCDINTKYLKAETLKGDILVVATGKEKLITADMVKPGAIVIDCGAPKPEVDTENVEKIAAAITPVPGGIGPLTVISLLENLVEAGYNQAITHTESTNP